MNLMKEVCVIERIQRKKKKEKEEEEKDKERYDLDDVTLRRKKEE